MEVLVDEPAGVGPVTVTLGAGFGLSLALVVTGLAAVVGLSPAWSWWIGAGAAALGGLAGLILHLAVSRRLTWGAWASGLHRASSAERAKNIVIALMVVAYSAGLLAGGRAGWILSYGWSEPDGFWTNNEYLPALLCAFFGAYCVCLFVAAVCSGLAWIFIGMFGPIYPFGSKSEPQRRLIERRWWPCLDARDPCGAVLHALDRAGGVTVHVPGFWARWSVGCRLGGR